MMNGYTYYQDPSIGYYTGNGPINQYPSTFTTNVNHQQLYAQPRRETNNPVPNHSNNNNNNNSNQQSTTANVYNFENGASNPADYYNRIHAQTRTSTTGIQQNPNPVNNTANTQGTQMNSKPANSTVNSNVSMRTNTPAAQQNLKPINNTVNSNVPMRTNTPGAPQISKSANNTVNSSVPLRTNTPGTQPISKSASNTMNLNVHKQQIHPPTPFPMKPPTPAVLNGHKEPTFLVVPAADMNGTISPFQVIHHIYFKTRPDKSLFCFSDHHPHSLQSHYTIVDLNQFNSQTILIHSWIIQAIQWILSSNA